MDGIHIFGFGNLDNAVNIQISIDRTLFRVKLVGLVGLRAEEGIFILFRINGNGSNIQLI